MVISAIKNQFKQGEFSIFEAGDVFNFVNKSIVGAKSFCISNQGRVFAHDAGGIFGEEQLKVYTGTIKVSFDDYGVKISNNENGPFSFRASLNTNNFLAFYEKVPQKFLTFDMNDRIPSIIQYNNESDEVTNYTVQDWVKIETNKLLFSGKGINEIPFYRVKSVTDKDKYLELSSIFNIGELVVSKVKLFFFDDKVKNNIKERIMNHTNIFRIVGNISQIYTTHLTTNVSGKIVKDKKIAFCMDSENIYLIDEFKNESLAILVKSEITAFYSESDSKVAIIFNNTLHEIEALDERFREYLTCNLIENENEYKCKIGLLNGILNGETCNGEEVGLLIEGSILQFYITNNFRLLSKININKYEFQIDTNKLFIINKDEIALLRVNESEKTIEKFQNNKYEVPFGFTTSNDPFFIKQDEEQITLLNSSTLLFEDYNEKIKDISIKEYGDQDSEFSLIEISTVNGNLVINVPNIIIKDLISKTYFYSKNKSLDIVPPEQMYLSYSRQVNEYILFQYFGQVFAMYEGLKEIQRAENNVDLKNKKIINYLYYSIQTLKKHFDKVSIYLPSMLANEDLNLIQDQNVQIPYKNLQKSLLNVSNQINRALNEIESSIHSVSFVLIPREEYTKIIEKRKKFGYITSTSMVALGSIATMLSGLLAAPFLVGGLMTGISTYFNDSLTKEQEEIAKVNENARIMFSVDRMIDSLEHLIHTLLPYYIDETNTIVYQSFQQLYQTYKPKLESKEVKNELFNRITQLYTFKNLPIDDYFTTKKKVLIEMTHSSLNKSQIYNQQFYREVIGNVPKSNETAK